MAAHRDDEGVIDRALDRDFGHGRERRGYGRSHARGRAIEEPTPGLGLSWASHPARERPYWGGPAEEMSVAKWLQIPCLKRHWRDMCSWLEKEIGVSKCRPCMVLRGLVEGTAIGGGSL